MSDFKILEKKHKNFKKVMFLAIMSEIGNCYVFFETFTKKT